MSKTVWHRSPPPEIGWWPASICRDKNVLRWWDGARWSLSAYPTYTKNEASLIARQPDCDAAQTIIKWTERWWLK